MLATELPFAFSSDEGYSFLYMLFGELALIIPIVVGFSFMNAENVGENTVDTMGLRGFPLRLLPFIILLPIAGLFFINWASMPLQSILTLLFGEREYDFADGADSFLQNVVLMCVLAPIFEELLCRGVLMNLFRRYGTAKMLVYSSLGFALLHLDAEAVIPLFFVGLILGMIRITTDSVFASMVSHSASNLFALVSITFGHNTALLNFVTAVLFPMLVWFYLKGCPTRPTLQGLSEKSEPAGMSVGLVIVIAVFVLVNAAEFVFRLVSGELLYDLSGIFYY